MTPDQQLLTTRIADVVRRQLAGEGTGHDWWHIARVVRVANEIGAREGADLFVVTLGALLHDIADWKFHHGDDTVGPRVARQILEEHRVPTEIIDHVCAIVAGVSFKGAGVATPMHTREGQVVQDADRMDALGAIGIARAFAYGGHRGRLLHDPTHPPVLHQTKETYIASTGTTINHFYEKLLLLKDRMHTATAREMAAQRHQFMEQYLTQFFAEWKGDTPT